MTDLAEPDICSSVDLHQGSEPEGAQDQFGVLFDTMFDGAYVVDRERRILEWNPAATALSGYSSEQILGHRCSDNFLVHVDECGNKLCVDHCPLQATIDDGVARQMRVYLRHKQGHRIPVTVRTAALKDQDGRVTGAVEVFREVSTSDELGRRMAELERLAFLDKLTNLPNRRYAENRLAPHNPVQEERHRVFRLTH